MNNSQGAAIVAGCAVVFALSAAPARAEQSIDPNFDLDAFHRHAQAGAFQHKIVRAPECAEGRGVRGAFVMETPEQGELPLSVVTTVGPAGTKSFVMMKGPTLFSQAVLSDVANTFNEEAKVLVKKIIMSCRSAET